MRSGNATPDRDMVVHGIASHADCALTTISEEMTLGVLIIYGHAIISKALRSVLCHGLHRLTVIADQQQLIGMLTLNDTRNGQRMDLAGQNSWRRPIHGSRLGDTVAFDDLGRPTHFISPVGVAPCFPMLEPPIASSASSSASP